MAIYYQKPILDKVILGYRNLIETRYTYENLQKRPDFPKSFTEERVLLFKNYFLDYLYPTPDKRDELNEAFQSLDSYLKRPEKLFRLVLDSSSLVFKYGRHLPKILSVGLKALKSFRGANKFEGRLVENAIQAGLKPPFGKTEIEEMIRSLSRKEVEAFIQSTQTLFETLHDRALIEKITEVIDQLIAKMKKRPRVYGPAEIRGLEMGREIISMGDKLFDQLSVKEQERVFDFIVAVERENLDGIFLGGSELGD